jgi:hypothetical protein
VYGHAYRRHEVGHSRTTAGLCGYGLSRWHAHPLVHSDYHSVGGCHPGCADLRSPGTMAHLRQHPAIAITVVDECTRKGSRLQGLATALEAGALCDELVAFDTPQGHLDAPRRLHTIVLVTVHRALPLVSPAMTVT